MMQRTITTIMVRLGRKTSTRTFGYHPPTPEPSPRIWLMCLAPLAMRTGCRPMLKHWIASLQS